MVKIGALTIPEHQSIALKPGGKHLMLIDPKKFIAEGEEINLIIELSRNETMTLSTSAVSRF
jgi:copper(I)-binding protein